MPTSGSSDFSLNARNVVYEAMTLIGVRSEGAPAVEAYDAQEALRALNLMLKSWSVKLHQWLQTEGTITPLASTAAYLLTPKAYKVASIRSRIASNDLPLIAMSREQYYDLPTKAQTGRPLQFFYDPQQATGTVYLWPTPDASFAASGALRYTYSRQIQDLDSLDDDLDVPQEWLEALCYSLADRLAIKYPAVGAQARADIKERAAVLYQGLSDFDQEDVSLFFQPDMS